MEGRDAILRDLGRAERWDGVNCPWFNQAGCIVLHLGQGNPKHRHRLRSGRIESNHEKDLGLLVD